MTRMNYNQINEAIIRVPQELTKEVNKYISSFLYFKIKQYLERMEMFKTDNTSTEEFEKIKKTGLETMGKLQQKYGARNISPQTAMQISNKSIKLNLDSDKFFKELNFKGITPKLIELLKDQYDLELYIDTNSSSSSHGKQETEGRFNLRITVNTSRLNPRDWLTSANNIMSTAYHEMQHTVQSMALKNINSNDKQVEMKPNYDTDEADYYTSGIEYTPQLGNLVDSVIGILEKDTLNNSLESNKSTAIKNAINDVVENNESQRRFLIYLYTHDKAAYKKAMKEIYSKASPIYDDFKQNGIDYAHTDLPSEELEANINIPVSIYKMFQTKEDKFYTQVFGHNMANIQSVLVSSNSEHWQIVFAKTKNDYMITLSFGNAEEEVHLDAQKTLNLAGIISESPWFEADDVIDEMEILKADLKEASDKNIKEAIDLITDDASYYELDFKRIAPNKFMLFGKEFALEKSNDTKVDVSTSDDSIYYHVSLKQFVNLFQLFIRYYSNDEFRDEVIDIMHNSRAYMEVINNLRNL